MRAVIAAFAALAWLSAPALAFAHATPVAYEPDPAVTQERMPERVRIRFSERVEPKASGIIVYAPDGSRADAGDAAADPADARVFDVPVADRGEGTYTVSWQVVSADDGHFTKGAFGFSVGKETAAASAGQLQIRHVTATPQIAATAAEMLGQALLLGAIAVGWILRRRRHMLGADAVSAERRLRGQRFAGALLALAGADVYFMLKTQDLAAIRAASFFETAGVFFGTLDGRHAALRAMLALAALVVLVAARGGDARRAAKADKALLVLALLMVADRARVSHAAASHFLPWFSVGINALHLAAKEFWTGGLVAMAVAVLPSAAAGRQRIGAWMADFDRMAAVAAGAVAATGAYVVWLHLKDPAFIVSTQWGRAFLVLTAAATILVGLRLLNQQVLPRWPTWHGRAFVCEALVALAVVSLSARLVLTTPPHVAEAYLFSRTSGSQGAAATLSVHPYEPRQFLLRFTDDFTDRPTRIEALTVTLTNEEKGIGPLVVETVRRSDSGFILPRDAFSPPGDWRVDVMATRPVGYDAAASFRLRYPDDVTSGRIDPDVRRLDGFGIFMLLIGLGGLAFGAVLFLSAKDRGSSAPGLRSPWLYGTAGALLTASLVVSLDRMAFRTPFERRCLADGNMWMQSVPMRDGAALSSDTFSGCSTMVGQYHFPDADEYAHFFRPVRARAGIELAEGTLTAGEPVAMEVAIVEEGEGGAELPPQELSRSHERYLHAVIVGEDMATFAHIHPEDVGPVTPEMLRSGRFPLRHAFPKAGRYLMVLDFAMRGRSGTDATMIEIAGEPAMTARTPIVAAGRELAGEFDGYSVRLTTPASIRAGDAVHDFRFRVEKDGEPVKDLQPYLGAPMHIAAVRAGLDQAMHAHGELPHFGVRRTAMHAHFVPDRFGPRIDAHLSFPLPGTYVIFGEFRHADRTIVASFPILVR